jgi:hypothetical protein
MTSNLDMLNTKVIVVHMIYNFLVDKILFEIIYNLKYSF